jgi:hypothetical protein
LEREARLAYKAVHHNRNDVFEIIKDVTVVFGKGLGSEPIPNDDNKHALMWKKKSIFWNYHIGKSQRSAMQLT